MKYLDILDCDVINGLGVRVTLFTSGCSHKCKGCHNPESWNYNAGKEFDENVENKLMELLSRDYIDGLTLSGGDPLFIPNRVFILDLCKKVKSKFPNKNIWLYTGYTYEQIKDDILVGQILKYVDVLVDGKFDINLKDTTLAFRGSSNQRIIDIKKSLSSGGVVTLDF